jgi:hypothetical protein
MKPKAKIALERVGKVFELLRDVPGEYAVSYFVDSSTINITLPRGRVLQRKTLDLLRSEFRIVGMGPAVGKPGYEICLDIVRT